MPNEQDILLTIGQCAEYLHVSDTTIRNYYDDGKLKGVQSPSGHRKIWKSSLDELKNNGVTQSNPEKSL
jgi:excisionase family DNA binding protein